MFPNTVPEHRQVTQIWWLSPFPIPEKVVSSTGRRPNRSDRAPRIGAPMKLAAPKLQATTPYQKALSAFESEKLPTSAGSTGMITPMSMRTAVRMKKIVPVRRGRVVDGERR
jgi:hypothetical protein